MKIKPFKIVADSRTNNEMIILFQSKQLKNFHIFDPLFFFSSKTKLGWNLYSPIARGVDDILAYNACRKYEMEEEVTQKKSRIMGAPFLGEYHEKARYAMRAKNPK